MTRRKFFLFAAAAALLSVVVMLAGLLALDLYIHHRAERSAGLNRWGYSGPVVGRKQPGETRVAVLGGSTTFGYGVTWDEAMPALLEQRLNQRFPDRLWRGLNLGYNNEGAFAFLPNLEDFAHLDYDLVIFYEGYNDLPGDQGPNWTVVRRQSPVFRSTGYFPILPLALREKAMALRTGGNLDAGYAQQRGGESQTVFRPNLAGRTSAGILEAASAISESFARQFEQVAASESSSPSAPGALGCPAPWNSYCDAQYRAIRYLAERGTRVLVVSQPQLVDPQVRERHDHQRQVLEGMVARHFGSNPRVAYVSVAKVVDLSDRDVSFDQMHLSVDGNRLIAEALVEPVRRLAIQP